MRHADRLAAYEALLREYQAPLRRLVHAYTREPGEREDLFQDVALALWTALPMFRGDASQRTWLYRVAHNTAIGFSASACGAPSAKLAATIGGRVPHGRACARGGVVRRPDAVTYSG